MTEIRSGAAGRHALRAGVSALLALSAWGAVAAPAQAAGPTSTTTYSSPGSYTFTVPTGVTSITVTAIGAAGGGFDGSGCGSVENGGKGASISASLPVSPGEQLFVGVGGTGSGTNCADPPGAGGLGGGAIGGSEAGGGFTNGAGGGGASVVGVASPSPGFDSLLMVAGGGGGAADGWAGGDAGAAGAGTNGSGGGAGTSSAGGAAGTSTDGNGSPGSFGRGGAGGNSSDALSGGGGGGGYYGGGGGAGGNITPCPCAGGGGGGSSFFSPEATNTSGPTPTSTPAGVTITYAAPTADESPSSLAFGTEPQGVAGTEQDLTVSNHGSAPLVVSGVMLGGADPGDFLLDNGCQQPVAVGASCQIGVRFSPQAQGSRSASLTVLTNAASAPPAVALSGTGGQLPEGPSGPKGDTGNTGPQGPAGEIELVTCKPATKTIKRHKRKVHVQSQQCTTELVSGVVKFATTGSVAHVAISRAGDVYATGVELAARNGSQRLVLTVHRRLTKGRWTLTTRQRRGHHWITRRRQIMIR